MNRLPFLLAIALMIVSCGSKENPLPEPGPVAPTTISLSPTSLQVPQSGGSYSLEITAPSRPSIAAKPDWVTVQDGTYQNYRISIRLNVAPHDLYEPRKAEIRISAAGAPDAILLLEQAAKEVQKDPVLADNEAVALSRRLGLGWNMGNHFDAYYNGSWAGAKEGFPDEEVWGNARATQETFQRVKAAGFTSVRIPVSWLKMIGEGPDYKIDPTWLNRVYEVALWAHEAGLYVIVNTHHDENHGTSHAYEWLDIKSAALDESVNQTIQAEIRAVWTQIAERFRDCGDWLILESFNELNDGGWGWSEAFRAHPEKQCGILDRWNQVFVDAVRATGGENASRYLGVPSYAANPEFTKYMTLPDDPAGKLMISVHFYDPSAYTIGSEQYEQWGHTAQSGKKASGGDEDHVKEIFGYLYTQYVARNIPVYLGEFGCSVRAQSQSTAWAFYLYYLEYIVKAAKTYGMPCFLWDNGAKGSGQEQHGYLDHGNGNYISNSKIPIDVMVKARFNEETAYTLQSVYDSAPVF